MSKKGGFPVGHEPGVGRGDFANLPQDVKMTAYPKAKTLGERDLDDTLTGIDEVMTRSEGKARKYVSNQK